MLSAMNLRTVLSSLLTLALLTSCGGDPAAAVAGVYTLDKDALKAAMAAQQKQAPEGEANPMAGMMEKMIESMEISMDLKADGTVSMKSSMTMMGETKNDESEGSWKLEGDKVVITPPDGESKAFTLKDGRLSATENGMFGEQEMVFVRKNG